MRLQSLTLLRGIAALTAVTFHLARSDGPSLPAFFQLGLTRLRVFTVAATLAVELPRREQLWRLPAGA